MKSAFGVPAAAVVLLLLQSPAPAAPLLSGSTLAQAPAPLESAYVRGIQKELHAHGYDAGPVDGIAGHKTRAAIRAYQIDAGLPEDGAPSRRLLDHLKFAQPKIYTFGQPVMGTVLEVQRELAERNYYLGPHDGLAGPATLRALSRFQADAGLPQDDHIDSLVLQKIRDTPPEVEADPAAYYQTPKRKGPAPSPEPDLYPSEV
ncbi:MAG: hypothetical protein Tsb0032_07040 [Kiloniellaceae bacterium]